MDGFGGVSGDKDRGLDWASGSSSSGVNSRETKGVVTVAWTLPVKVDEVVDYDGLLGAVASLVAAVQLREALRVQAVETGRPRLALIDV